MLSTTNGTAGSTRQLGSHGSVGGFGGGGGSYHGGGGGGGGYTGGHGGGIGFNIPGGGGGGSYTTGSQALGTAGVRSGHGQVIISWKTHRFWRVLETGVTVGHSPRTAELRWKDATGVARTPVAVSTNLSLNSDYDAGLPFDGVTNTVDRGWIASFSGSNRHVTADHGAPGYSMTEFAAFTSYTGGQRGATWQVFWSDDQQNWNLAAVFDYTTCNLCAQEAANGFGCWYRVTWTEASN
jgi:hypothetical protein